MPDKAYSRTVYTTSTGRVCPICGQPIAGCRCKKQSAAATAGDGVIRVALDRKGRAGKSVTVITGLPGAPDQLKELAAELKRRCGTGGTLKNGVIEIQGDHRDALVEVLREKKFTVKRVGG